MAKTTDKEKPSEKREPLSTPLKVQQDDFSPGRGNALQAAVASIFGLSLIDVPNFITMPDGYEAAIRKFCQDFYGGTIDCIKVKLMKGDIQNVDMPSECIGKLCILRGKSPRGDFGHVVVARYIMSAAERKFEMVHDPHPEGTFLDGKEKPGWCMFFV